jgi:sulfate adenylyltransferase large subunit
MRIQTAQREYRVTPLSDESFGRGLVRFNTAGSVDNGKSTLIGRLLYDSGGLPDDVIATIAARSRDSGKLNLAAFTDGLKAERERGITIDASYRYFQRGEKDFIVADSPGHFEFTRNMLTATSHSDATLILVDAEHGIVEQNRRHAYLASMAGVKNLAILVNKLDLFGYSHSRFDEIKGEFSELLDKLPGVDVTYIPVSALHGENIVQGSQQMPWYEGPSVLAYLEELSPQKDIPVDRIRAVVQWVERETSSDRREVVVRLDEGSLANRERLRSNPGGEEVVVDELYAHAGFVEQTSATQARFQVPRFAQLRRGDSLSRAEERRLETRQVEAHICWMDEVPLVEDKTYLVRIGGQLVEGTISAVLRRIDIGTFEAHENRDALRLNEVGSVQINLSESVAIAPFSADKKGGALILIDPRSGHTVAAGGVVA